MDIYFRTFHVYDKAFIKEIGRITVAKRFSGDGIQIGVAYCGPKDRYNKKKGQLIAAGRLIKGGSGKRVQLTDRTLTTIKEAVLALAEVRKTKWLVGIEVGQLV